ncbi:MAG: transglycosylase SLT domain-containing protein [Flavobacteriales bacterium]|nr:transglycosylase SLT domain-containing protein [Flavobacteriales bacterium]
MKSRWIIPAIVLFTLACDDIRRPRSTGTPVDRDLQAIAKDTLRVGVLEDALTWEERTHGYAGAEWDLLNSFALKSGIPIVPVPMESVSELCTALLGGNVDLIAAQLGERTIVADGIRSTEAFAKARPVMLFRRPQESKRKVAIDTVRIPEASAFAQTGLVLKDRFAELARVSSTATTTHLLDNVVLGKQNAVMVTELAAARALKQFPHLGGVVLSNDKTPLVFAVRANAQQLLAAINAHLASAEVELARANFPADFRFQERTGAYGSRTPAVVGDTISPFDKLFRHVADSLVLDWHLLAAIAFRESRYDTAAGSHMGAQGLMQLMPATARRFSGEKSPGLKGQVIAAAVYLKELDTLWQRSVPDRKQRQRFVLASYNAGESHVQDAQRLAAHFGLQRDKWENNVERALLLLSCPRHWRKPPVRNGFCNGSETFRFVRNVAGTWAYFGSVPDEEPVQDTTGFMLPLDTVVSPTGTQAQPDSVPVVVPIGI